MGTITALPTLIERGPHICGEVRCIQCNHSWTAVAPVGTLEFECPECHTLKGVLKYPCEPESAFVCNCGCHLYILSETGNMICYKCGASPGTFTLNGE